MTPDAFGAFVETHYDRMYRIAYSVLGHREDAQDLVQDVCLRLPAALESFDGRARVTTWLHRVVVNAARDKLRKLARRRLDGYADVVEAAAAESAEAAEKARWLTEALTALDDDLRLTAGLLIVAEVNQAEAAEILGVAPGTVAWRMSEIKKRLKARAEAERAT